MASVPSLNVPVRITGIQRSEVCDLLRSLGHEPAAVAEVHITPNEVDVVYSHPILGKSGGE